MKKISKSAAGIGAGLLAAGAAAAGYYFYASPKAKKHRKIAAKWATDMKNEVVKEAKRLPKATPKAFAALVDRIADTYEDVSSIDVEEVRRAANELKANWDKLSSGAKRSVRAGVAKSKSIAKSAKKSIKKSTKKRV